MFLQQFDIVAAANDAGGHSPTSWTLLVDRTIGPVHVEHTWSDAKPHRQGMRIVTLAEFLRSEIGEGSSPPVDAPKPAGIAANDP